MLVKYNSIMVLKQSKDSYTPLSKESVGHLRSYLDLSFISLFNKGLNICVKLFFVVCIFCPMHFNWSFLKIEVMLTNQISHSGS